MNGKIKNIAALMKVKTSQAFRKIRSVRIKDIKKFFYDSNDSNLKLSMSVSTGILIGILPIWGFQTILALFLSLTLKLNKAVLLTTFNISTPPLTPVVILASYFTGGLISGSNTSSNYDSLNTDISFSQINIYQYIIGSIVLAVLLSVLSGITTFLLLSVYRKRNKLIIENIKNN